MVFKAENLNFLYNCVEFLEQILNINNLMQFINPISITLLVIALFTAIFMFFPKTRNVSYSFLIISVLIAQIIYVKIEKPFFSQFERFQNILFFTSILLMVINGFFTNKVFLKLEKPDYLINLLIILAFSLISKPLKDSLCPDITNYIIGLSPNECYLSCFYKMGLLQVLFHCKNRLSEHYKAKKKYDCPNYNFLIKNT